MLAELFQDYGFLLFEGLIGLAAVIWVGIKVG